MTALALVLGPSTHLGAADLPGDLWDRLVLSWERATDGVGVGLVTAAAMVTLVVLVARWPPRPLPLAMAAAIAVSMLVNDSPQDVALGGLVGWLGSRALGRPRTRTIQAMKRRAYGRDFGLTLRMLLTTRAARPALRRLRRRPLPGPERRRS